MPGPGLAANVGERALTVGNSDSLLGLIAKESQKLTLVLFCFCFYIIASERPTCQSLPSFELIYSFYVNLQLRK